MELKILLVVVWLVLLIGVYPLCSLKYRPEDAERIADGTITVRTRVNKLYAWLSWITAVIFCLLLKYSWHERPIEESLGILVLVALVFLALALSADINSYYIVEKERLTYVKHCEARWSYKWEEIEYAELYRVGEWKFFKIVTKDDMTYDHLPECLRDDLKEHVPRGKLKID